MPHVAVRGDEVLHHLDELANASETTLSTVRIGEHAERAEDRETVFLAQTVTVNGATTTLERALEGCGAFASTHPCRVDARTRIVLREVSQAMLDEERAAAHAHPDDDPGPHTNGYNPPLAHVTGAFALIGLGGTILCAVAVIPMSKRSDSAWPHSYSRQSGQSRAVHVTELRAEVRE